MPIAFTMALLASTLSTERPAWVPSMESHFGNSLIMVSGQQIDAEAIDASRRCQAWAIAEVGTSIRNRDRRRRVVNYLMVGCVGLYVNERAAPQPSPDAR